MPNIAKVKSLLPTTRGGSRRQTTISQTPQETSLSLRPVITPSSFTMDSSANWSPPHLNSAMVNHAEVYASMKIPDPIKSLPPYSGDPFTLNEFIENVEEIILMIRTTDQTTYGQMCLRAIRRKIEGKANEEIISAGANLNWDEIKDALIRHCSDKRDEETLMTELHELKHRQLSIQRSYEQITKIRLALFRIIDTEETEQIAIQARRRGRA
ncbi:uncharacterized protein LOC108111546 [Drosophila eugracilis]|uniref:uncharacterized protein LOC108111546 n=1 Tax=Drosophila eugracilis TaxID=29029 RepID=UPI0007E71368|nr:uncharacterized protein LOC108111546 [Drosophila eugracilis]